MIGEAPFIPFYKPYGMLDEEYAAAQYLAELQYSEWYEQGKQHLLSMVKTSYKWTTDNNDNWLKYYPQINEDNNSFETREQAILWIAEQKNRIEDFGNEECFILTEMFFV